MRQPKISSAGTLEKMKRQMKWVQATAVAWQTCRERLKWLLQQAASLPVCSTSFLGSGAGVLLNTSVMWSGQTLEQHQRRAKQMAAWKAKAFRTKPEPGVVLSRLISVGFRLLSTDLLAWRVWLVNVAHEVPALSNRAPRPTGDIARSLILQGFDKVQQLEGLVTAVVEQSPTSGTSRRCLRQRSGR